MRLLFFGTSAFAVPTLEALHEAAPRHAVLAVVTQPDRPRGRGRQLQMTPIKERALALGYTVLQPERVRRKAFLTEARALAPDALVVVSFGQILPQALLDLPRHGGINVHASLLPRWRGAAPIHHAIIAGDPETGVATMQMEATLDTGPVFLTAREPIRDDDTVGTLEPRLAALGGPLLVETLDRLERGDMAPVPQADDGVTYAPPVEREHGFLAPRAEDAVSLERRVRGTDPRPGAFLRIGERTVKVLQAEVLDSDGAAGVVDAVRKDGVLVGTARGGLLLKRVQPENRGAMPAADWARGARIAPGEPVTPPAV